MGETGPKTIGSTGAEHSNHVLVRADSSVLFTTRAASCVYPGQILLVSFMLRLENALFTTSIRSGTTIVSAVAG